MSEDQEAGAAATVAKSPSSDKTFQERFNAALETWRAQGCPRRNEKGLHLCKAAPHRAKMLPEDSNGNVTMAVDCVNGHEDVWEFVIPAVEMRADIERQAQAAQRAAEDASKGPQAARDPMKASLKITMDLRTQEISIDPWVPTPGLGIQLAGILMSHFFAQLQNAGAIAPKIAVPDKRILDPKTGKPVVFQ